MVSEDEREIEKGGCRLFRRGLFDGRIKFMVLFVLLL